MACEIQWITQVLKDLRVEYKGSAMAYCDNKSAIHLAENPVFHERTKHIVIDCHIIRERVRSGLVTLKYVCTDRNLADLFTKGLSAHWFKWIVFKLGVYDIYSSACGGLSSSMSRPEGNEDEDELEAPVQQWSKEEEGGKMRRSILTQGRKKQEGNDNVHN
ncbi:unnamed protein product [Linum trigynum]|uniref:Uncharacterized protein n=1 Tax=Linum trigynum TaxID=586398 RepID=A0AAV2DWI2_9ROSI